MLKTGCFIDLEGVFVILSFRRNLISVSILDKSGYSCTFENHKVKVTFSNHSDIIGHGYLTLTDNLYVLESIASYPENLYIDSYGTKQKLTDESSAALWHKCLGHISEK